MKEKNFLFKLGAVLVPAVFAVSSPVQSLWIAGGVALVLLITHAWGALMRRVAPSLPWSNFPTKALNQVGDVLLGQLFELGLDQLFYDHLHEGWQRQ